MCLEFSDVSNPFLKRYESVACVHSKSFKWIRTNSRTDRLCVCTRPAGSDPYSFGSAIRTGMRSLSKVYSFGSVPV